MKTAIPQPQQKIARFGNRLALALTLALAGLSPLALTTQAQPRPSFNQGPSRRPLPSPGFFVQTPPRGYVTLNFGNSFYYTSGGVFYQAAPHGYVVVAPPAGLRMRTLPVGAMRVMFNGALFYNYNNVYFQPVLGGGFVVVNPPPGIVVVAPPPVIVRPMPPPVIVRPVPPPPMRPGVRPVR